MRKEDFIFKKDARDKSLGLPEWQKTHKTASYHFSPQVNITVRAHQIRYFKLTFIFFGEQEIRLCVTWWMCHSDLTEQLLYANLQKQD